MTSEENEGFWELTIKAVEAERKKRGRLQGKLKPGNKDVLN